MWRFSANLTTLWTALPLERRVAAAAAAGFGAIECAYPYEHDAPRLRRAAREAGVAWCMINLPAGDRDQGERGLACRPGRAAAFRDSVETGLRVAEILGVQRLTCMVGRSEPHEDRGELWQIAVDRLRWAGARLAEHGLELQVEALNPHDAPGFLIQRPEEALALADEVALPSVRVQFDAYHALRTETDVLAALRASTPRLGHVHLADVPDRAVPGTGTLPVAAVLALLDDLGYGGGVGLEYAVEAPDASTFAWLEPWRRHLGGDA